MKVEAAIRSIVRAHRIPAAAREDLESQAKLEVWSGYSRLATDPERWARVARGVARHLCVRHFRERKRLPKSISDLEQHAARESDVHSDPREPLDRDTAIQSLRGLVQRCGVRYAAAVLELFVLGGRSAAETARVIGCHKKQVYRCFEQLLAAAKKSAPSVTPWH